MHLAIKQTRIGFAYTVLFLLLMTSHDAICVSEFVVFNNVIIFVVSFSKTAKLLFSIVIWVEEANVSLNNSSYEFALLDDYRMNFVINTG